MNDNTTAKNYLKLFIARNNLLNQFNFKTESNKYISLHDINTHYSTLSRALQQGLTSMTTEARQTLYANMFIFKEKAYSELDKLNTEKTASLSSIIKLSEEESCLKIIQGVENFENYIFSLYPEEFSSDVFDSKIKPIIIKKLLPDGQDIDTITAKQIQTSFDDMADNVPENFSSSIVQSTEDFGAFFHKDIQESEESEILSSSPAESYRGDTAAEQPNTSLIKQNLTTTTNAEQ